MFFVFFTGSAPFVKDRPYRVPPYIILVSRATLITISEPPRCVSSLVLLFFVLIRKFPTKIAPIFFVICWCDEVLLDLIRGFRVLQVDLAFPHLFPNFHPQNLPNFAPDLTSPRGVHPRIPSPDIRPDQPGHPVRPGHPAPDSINSILHSAFRLTFVQFCSGAHIHFRIPPPFPHSTTISA